MAYSLGLSYLRGAGSGRVAVVSHCVQVMVIPVGMVCFFLLVLLPVIVGCES